MSKFPSYAVGFHEIWDRMTALQEDTLAKMPSYPPYNIKKVDDNKYLIEMALAGFSKQDIEITLEDDKLKVAGAIKADSLKDFPHLGAKDEDYLYKGIAVRNFDRVFTLADNIEIQNASMLNGMLRIWLDAVIPEAQKPRKIDIDEAPKAKSKKELLNETN